MHKNPILIGIIALALAILSCNTPQGQQIYDLQTKVAMLLTATAAGAAAVPPGAPIPAGQPPVPPGVVPPAAPPPASATPCTPIVTANQNANVRFGPSTLFDPPVGNLLTGQTAEVQGKNEDGSWWYIVFAGAPTGHGWISSITVNASCLPATVASVAGPPTPTEIVVVVTDVSVSVDPATIGVPGCMGPILPSTVSATISTNGPIKLKIQFVSQQLGNLSGQTVNFTKAGSKDVSDEFTPPLTAGKYWVKIVIQGQDLGGMDTQATYKISC